MSEMQPAILDHYVVMKMGGLYNEATFVMIRTRTPYHGRGHHFQVQSGHGHDHETGMGDDYNEHD